MLMVLLVRSQQTFLTEILYDGGTEVYRYGPSNMTTSSIYGTLNALITTKVVCFSRPLKCLRSLYGIQCGPRADCSFASIRNSSVMLGNYLQQTTSADDIFRCIFFLPL